MDLAERSTTKIYYVWDKIQGRDFLVLIKSIIANNNAILLKTQLDPDILISYKFVP